MRIKELVRYIKSDVKTHAGVISFKALIICYYNPSFRLLLNYRIGKYFHKSSFKLVRFFSVYYKYKQVTKRNCQISLKADLGENVKFNHPLGIVIGDGVIVKDNVRIWQHVTLGSHGKKGQELQYPVINSGVKIYTGATVIGGIEVGEGAMIGANSVVNVNVPAKAIAVGIPAKILVK